MTRHWKKEYRKILLWVGIIGSILIFLSDKILLDLFCYTISGFSFGDKLQTAILYSTAVIIFWYSKETFDLKRVQQKELQEVRQQTEYEILPFLRLQYNENSDVILTIANDGRGLAKSVVFEEVSMGPVDHILKFTIASRPVIAAGGNSGVSTDEIRKICSGVMCYRDNNIGRYIGRCLKDGFAINAQYRDVTDRLYRVVFQSDPSYNDGFRISFQGRILDKIN